MYDLKSINIGVEPKSKINDRFIFQKVNSNHSEYITNVDFKGSKYKNILYFSY